MEKYEVSKKELEINFEFMPLFDNTQEISEYKDIIGQDRAVEAIELGLKISKPGYNIYIAGDNGTGKKNYVLKKIRDYSASSSPANDWCYVYNFKDDYKPVALWFNNGEVEDFQREIDSMIDNLFVEVPKFFSSDNYEKDRNEIIDRYQKEILRLADKLYEESKEKGFIVKSTAEGFAFIPIVDDKEMSERQYNELDNEQKEKINTNVSSLKLLALEILRQTKLMRKGMSEELAMLDERISLLLLSDKIKLLKEKYIYNLKIVEYLKDLQEDIIENIEAFMEHDESDERYDEGFYKRYSVNIMVCNSNTIGAPVVFEELPEYHNLLGIIEYENKQGSMVTDFTMIKPGSLHKANGGYLIIDALQLLTSYHGWEALKRCIKNSCIFIENLKNQFDIIPIAGLKPEEIPLYVKIVIIGSEYIYHVLYNYDEDFKELFKIKADFNSEIKNINGNAMKILGFISGYCNDNKILPISRDGIVEILRYSSRLTESKKYFTGTFTKITDIIEQANIIAREDNNEYIEKRHVDNVVKSINKRHGMYKEKILEMYREGKYIVDIKNLKVGEINGLSVIDLGDCVFGKQNRITVTTYSGKNGIVNIERESKMSGNIHSKGILILSGYIGENLGQSTPLSFNANICFEQLYGEIDGDSASAAELIALMSSLSGIPIKQSIAVTGSINQKGEIQPVGGINEKIEGFFDICSLYGIDGTQGVIIPYTNIDDLVLKDEVIDAVDKKLFHIYAVKRINECFEILCEENIRNAKEDILETIKDSINSKLLKFNKSEDLKRKK
jgi:lon-related putative ATP-dependent protease